MKRGCPVKINRGGQSALFLERCGYKKKQCKILNEKNLIEVVSLSEITEVEDKHEAIAIVEKILNIKGAAGKKLRCAVATVNQPDFFR